MTLRAIDSPDRRASAPAGRLPLRRRRHRVARAGPVASPRASAAAARMDKIDRNIYCIIGDGESREGQIWEAADFIVDHALTNVVPIFNCNELAQSDWVSPQQSYQGLAEKLEAFGFIVRVDRRARPAGNRATRSTNCTSSRTATARWRSSPAPSRAGARRPSRAWASTARRSRRTSCGEVLGELDQTAKDLGVADYKVERRAEDRRRPRRPPSRAETQADQDRVVRRGAGGGRHGQGPGRRQADRPAQGVRRGPGGAGRGGQAHRRARRRREELARTPSGSPRSSRPSTSSARSPSRT